MEREKLPGGEFKQIESFKNPENNHPLDSKIEQQEIMDLAIATAKKKVNEVGGVRTNPDLLLHGAYKRMEAKAKDNDKDIDEKAFDYALLENMLRAGLVTPDFLERARKMTKPQTQKDIENIDLSSVTNNPHNKRWVSFIKTGSEKLEELLAAAKDRGEGSQWSPVPALQLAEGYADMERSAYMVEGEIDVEKYIFIYSAEDMKVADTDDYRESEKIQDKYKSSMHNTGENLRFLRAAPRFCKGIMIPVNAECKIQGIVDTMKKVYGRRTELYLPIYNACGDLLWPKMKPEEIEGVETPEIFLEKIKNRNDAAFIFLKGGYFGGLQPQVKHKILERLSKWFNISEGRQHCPNIKEINSRWSAGLEYQFKKMMNNPIFRDRHDGYMVRAGRSALKERSMVSFDYWLEDVKEMDANDSGFLRQELVMDYFSQKGQILLLKLKSGVTREAILEDLGLTGREDLVKAVGEKKADFDWADSEKIILQDFVKNIIVGETTSYKAADGTIRSIVAQELKQGNLKGAIKWALELKEKNPNVWKVGEGDYNADTDDEETVISTFLNAVHSVDLSIDEFSYLKDTEIKKFNELLQKEPEAEKSLKEIEFNLEQGIEKAVDEIKEISKTKKAGELVVVCIAGGSSSGKTSGVSSKLIKDLGEGALSISMDNYYKGRAFMKGLEKEAAKVEPAIEFMDTEKAENWDQPQALDLKLLARHLNELKQGKSIEIPKYEMNGSYRSDEIIPIDPAGKKIIVVEGLFALNDHIVKFTNPDYKIYVGSAAEDDDVHGRIIRRLIRDPKRTGLGEKDIFKYWVDVIEPMHREYIAPTKEAADIIINNEYNPETEAKKATKLEVQTKYNLAESELQDLLNKLEKSGAKIRDNFNQVDEYLVIPGHDPKNVDELLRIRREEDRYFITYKGPVEKEIEEFRVKPKIDFELTPNISQEEVAKLKEVLQNFGYRPLETITKQRKVYEISGIEIAVDDVGEIGKFIEIRADTKEEIRRLEELLKNLGLGEKTRINEPYIELSLKRREK